MNYKELYNMDLEGVYLLYGEEVLLIENTISYIEKKYVDKNFSLLNLIKVKDFEDFIKTTETLPVMSEKKVIIVEDASSFESKLLDVDEFIKFAEGISSYVIALFVDEKESLNKSKKFFKYFKKKKRAYEFSKVSISEVNKFVSTYFKREGIEISNADVNFLVSRTSYGSKNTDMTLMDLRNELNKFLSYKKISRQIIEDVLTETVDTNIFKLTDAIFSRNLESAVFEFKNLYEISEPIQKTFILIARAVRLMLGYKKLSKKKVMDYEIMNILGIGNFELGKVKSAARFYSEDELESSFKLLEEIDRNMKSTSIDPYTMCEAFLFKLMAK